MKSGPQADVDDFDPYHKWLGIPKDKRPPTLYQLLGISPSEFDPETIAAAVDRQQAFVKQFRGGSYDEQAATILFQLEDARTTLLNPEARLKYDQTLHLAHRRQRKTSQRIVSTPESGSRSVGEESGISKEFGRIIVILTIACAAMAMLSFYLPWGRVAHDVAKPAAVAANQPIPAPVGPPVGAPAAQPAAVNALPKVAEVAAAEPDPDPGAAINPPHADVVPHPDNASEEPHGDVVTIEGKLRSVDADKRTIKVAIGEETKAFDVSSEAEIREEDKDCGLESLTAGQKVILSLRGDAQIVQKIEAKANSNEWRTLSEGDAINGWAGDTQLWTFKEGIIWGKSLSRKMPGDRWLFTQEKFRNFTLTAKFRIRRRMVGIYFRYEPAWNDRPQNNPGSLRLFNESEKGYQFSLGGGDSAGDWRQYGDLRVFPRGKVVKGDPAALKQIEKTFKGREWHDLEIIADGKWIRTRIDGVTTVETEDDRYETGSIGFDVDLMSDVMFKDVRILVLP